MRSRMSLALAANLLAAMALVSGRAGASGGQEPDQKPSGVARSAVDRIVAGWSERPRLGAKEMMAKYGEPQEASSETLVWHRPGPFKRITVFRVEYPHDFPLPHMDFLEHTIDYNVPVDKTAALIAFDGSSTINRTAGELSARCDLEGHNILTLNLDHDIVTGKATVEQARNAFGDNVTADVMGKHPAYVEVLQFRPVGPSTRFPDQPVIPGSPKRMRPVGVAPAAGNDRRVSDAEVLGFVFAIDQNEVLAAAQAETKRVSPQVMEYAKMLHREHGTNQVATLKLGQQSGATPALTPAVDGLLVKGAGELAELVPLDGDEFGAAYVSAMVKGHTEALAMIDQFLQTAADAALKQHLTETRRHVADHLEKAKALQSGTRR